MPGILSQREIDALLSALPAAESTAGDVPKSENKPVKTYDFRRPDKFSKDQIRTLELIHDNFARRAGITLSARLRALVQINLISIEQVIYDEFVQQVPTPAVLYALTLDPLPGRAMLELHPSVAFIVVDRLLGGQGRALNRSRELTEVEMALIETVVWEILAAMKEGWTNVTTLQPKLTGDVGFTPQFLPIATATEICLVIAFEIRYGEESGLMRLCMPYVLLEPVLGQLTAQAWYASSRSTLPPERRAHLRQNLEAVKLPLIAVLGTTDLPIEEVLNLQKGDVILLDTSTTLDLTLTVAGRPTFSGRPGRVGRGLAVRVGEVRRDDDALESLAEELTYDAR